MGVVVLVVREQCTAEIAGWNIKSPPSQDRAKVSLRIATSRFQEGSERDRPVPSCPTSRQGIFSL